MNVTLYRNLAEVTTGFFRPVEFVFDRIRSGKSREIVEAVRRSEGKQQAELKKKLPCVNFQGEFRERNDKGLLTFSGLMPLDFDGIETEQELHELRETLRADKYTYALFISPSGRGLKHIIRIPADGQHYYKDYFAAAELWYKSPRWDKSSSNLSRLCFESYDPDIFVNPNAAVFEIKSEKEHNELGTDKPVFAITSDNRIIQNLLKWFHSKFRVVKGERNENLFRLAAALNSFGIRKNEAMHVLLDFQHQDFGAREIELLCESAYSRYRSEFGTRFFEDNDTKDRVTKQIKTGKSTAEIIKLLPDVPPEQIEKASENIRNNIYVEHYLHYTENGAVKLSPHKYKYWLENNKFAKYFPVDKKTYTFVKIDGKIIEETNEKRIKDYVLKDLIETEDNYKFYDYMANNNRFFMPEYLSLLDSSDVKLEADTADSCYIYYKNCIVKITANEIKQIDYFDVDGYVWKNQILERDYKATDHHDSVFRTFVWLVSGKNPARYKTLQSVIGYLMHSFKTSANNKAIIINDSVISDNPNGGSGKGIFWNAIARMKKVDSLNGKAVDLNKSFNMQTVKLDCQILVFDDVKKNFDFEDLFSLITEGITIEYKNQPAVKLPVSQSPKILITTNYTIGGLGGSFERRKFEVEFSSYFNAQHTPLDEFGHLLLDEWNEDEWRKFDNYMIQCVQVYLKNGLIPCAFDNIEIRKFIKNTCSEFYEWTKSHDFVAFGVRIAKKMAYDNFIEDFPDLRRWFTQKKMKQCLESYCHFYRFVYTEGNDSRGGLGRWFMITKHDQTTNEDLYAEAPF
jgi:hypothetical protein